MDKKHDYMGIIITVVIAAILMSVIPIYNNMTSECPPCEEVPSYNIGDIEVNPDFSSGNYNVNKSSYDYLDNVTIIKDENLIPENIKKGVDIYGVVGTYEEEGGLPFSYQGMGILFVSGHHSNFTTSSAILPPEGRIVCNDGTSDLNIDGILISFKTIDGQERINYSFIFFIPKNYTIKEFQLKSDRNWDRDHNSAVAFEVGFDEVLSIDLTMDEGYTTPNQFTRIFSFTTPQGISEETFITVNLATYKD